MLNALTRHFCRIALFTVSFVTPNAFAAAVPDSNTRPSESLERVMHFQCRTITLLRETFGGFFKTSVVGKRVV